MLMPKLHKSPLVTRLVCSDCGSLPHGLWRWIDQVLCPIVKDHDTSFKNSFELKKLLDPLRLPQNASLFTYRAVSMYTKIGMEECIHGLGDFIKLPAITEFYSIRPKATIVAIKLDTPKRAEKKFKELQSAKKQLQKKARRSQKKQKKPQKGQKKHTKTKKKPKQSTRAQKSQAEPSQSPSSSPWPLQPLIFANIHILYFLFLLLAESRSAAVIQVSIFYVMLFTPTPMPMPTLKHLPCLVPCPMAHPHPHPCPCHHPQHAAEKSRQEPC
jgi:hypothetical protein